MKSPSQSAVEERKYVKITIVAASTCLSVALLISGCTTNTPHPITSTTPSPEQDKLWTDASAYLDRLKDENKQLQSTNTALQAKLDQANKNLAQLNGYLQINNFLITNKQAVLQELQQEWTPHQQGLFQAMNGTGRVIECEITDAVLFNGYVVVDIAFLSSNNENTGTLTEGLVWLDPDKNFDPESCSATSTRTLSSQEFASLTSKDQGEEKAKDLPVPKSANPDGSWRMSQENKDLAVKTGITVVGGVVFTYLNSLFNGSN